MHRARRASTRLRDFKRRGIASPFTRPTPNRRTKTNPGSCPTGSTIWSRKRSSARSIWRRECSSGSSRQLTSWALTSCTGRLCRKTSARGSGATSSWWTLRLPSEQARSLDRLNHFNLIWCLLLNLWAERSSHEGTWSRKTSPCAPTASCLSPWKWSNATPSNASLLAWTANRPRSTRNCGRSRTSACLMHTRSPVTRSSTASCAAWRIFAS